MSYQTISKEQLESLPTCKDCSTKLHPRNFYISKVRCIRCNAIFNNKKKPKTNKKYDPVYHKRYREEKRNKMKGLYQYTIDKERLFTPTGECDKCKTKKTDSGLVFYADGRTLCKCCRKPKGLYNKKLSYR